MPVIHIFSDVMSLFSTVTFLLKSKGQYEEACHPDIRLPIPSEDCLTDNVGSESIFLLSRRANVQVVHPKENKNPWTFEGADFVNALPAF